MAIIPINSIWDPNDPLRIITGGVGWVTDGNKRLDYNNGNITYSSANAPNVRGLGFTGYPTPPQALMKFNSYEGTPPSQALISPELIKDNTNAEVTYNFNSYGAPDHASRGTRDEYEESLKRGGTGNISSGPYNPTYIPKQNTTYSRDLGFSNYGVPEVATKGYTPPTMNGVTRKVASNNKNTTPVDVRGPSPVYSNPSYTYAYQNTPAPTPVVQQSTPEQQYVNSQMGSQAGWDFYRKYVLRG